MTRHPSLNIAAIRHQPTRVWVRSLHPAVTLVLLVCLAIAAVSNLRLSAQIDQLRSAQQTASQREAEMRAVIVQQHRELRALQGHAEVQPDEISQQLHAVDVELNAVRRLAQRVRQLLGIEEPVADAAPPQGGGEHGRAAELLAAQARLADALGELQVLRLMLSGQTGHVDLGGASAGAILQPDGGDSVPSGWPLPGQLTSGFGWRQFLGRTQFHTGVDLAVGEATPVLAPASGTVLQAGSFPGYGNAVLILHGAGFASLVAHLSGFTVEIGDWVRRGQVVGHSGNTGNSTGPHLHYEVWLDGRVVDPGPYLSGAQ